MSQNVLNFMLYIINLYFVGLLDNPAMTAGVGLSITFVNVCGTSLMFGTNSAQETLTSQAFGAGELVRCGVLLNRGRVILLTLFIPISIIYFFSESIFLLMGIDS